MKSKTAFLCGPGDLRIDEVEVPQLKPDQVLVPTAAPLDRSAERRGGKGLRPRCPHDL